MSATTGAVRIDNAALRHEVRLARHGVGDTVALLAALRASVLYLPRSGDEAVMSAHREGVRWVFAFTSAAELADFAVAREDLGTPVRYATVRGDHLLETMRTIRGDSAVALDVAGAAPMFVPAPHLQPAGPTDEAPDREARA